MVPDSYGDTTMFSPATVGSSTISNSISFLTSWVPSSALSATLKVNTNLCLAWVNPSAFVVVTVQIFPGQLLSSEVPMAFWLLASLDRNNWTLGLLWFLEL